MAQLTTQKARKVYQCSKCGRTIAVGETYYKIVERFSKPKCRCSDCRPARSELTSSDYLSWLYDLQDNLTDRFDFTEDGSKDELYSEIENMRDELQERFDNIPEQFQEGDAACTLQERIDSLDEALDELDSYDYPDKEDDEFQEEDDEATCLCMVGESEERFTFDEFCVRLKEYGYYVDFDGDEDELADLVSCEEFDIVVAKGDERVHYHFEMRYHFDEEKFNEAVDEYASNIEEIVGNLE